MNLGVSRVSEKQSSKRSNLRLRVLIAYENRRAGIRAKLVIDRVLRQLEMINQCEIALWRFDLLDENCIRQEVARLAATSDVVLVSVSGENDVPRSVAEWLDLWSELRGNSPQVLGLILDSEYQPALEVMETALYFYRYALDGGIEIFLDWPSEMEHQQMNRLKKRRRWATVEA